MDAGLSKQVLHYHAAPMIRTPIINRLASSDSRQCASDPAPLLLISHGTAGMHPPAARRKLLVCCVQSEFSC